MLEQIDTFDLIWVSQPCLAALPCDPKSQEAEVLSLDYKELEASLAYKVASQTTWVTEWDCVFFKKNF